MSAVVTSRSRRRRGAPGSMWLAIGAALAVHLSVMGTISAVGVSLFAGGGVGRAPLPAEAAGAAAPEVVIKASCAGDAALAAAARAGLCLAPWRGDLGACADALGTDLLIDLSTCQGLRDSTAVTMISPKAAEKLKQIDPEPLLEAMAMKQPQEAVPVAPPPIPPPPPPPAAAQPPPQARPQQVVETAKPSQEQAAANARLLAEYDTKVEHQTVARGARDEPMVAKSKPAELVAKANPRDPSIKQAEPDRAPGASSRAPDAPGKLSMRAPGTPAPADVAQEAKARGASGGTMGEIADGVVPKKGDGAIEQARHEVGELPRGQGGAGGGAPPVPNLRPSDEVLERVAGGGSVDHLDDVDSGDETALSAKRWVYASFFNRLKRQVAQNWDPGTVWRRHDPTGTVYGYKTRVTEVRVSLAPDGQLAKVLVTGPCGVDELDEEAVRSFRAAAPFPNPPPGLVASDNRITFVFSFFFEIGAPRSSWKVIRSM